MKLLTAFFFFMLTSCQPSAKISKSPKGNESQDAFWSGLRKLCGKAFYGKIIEAPQSDTVFRNRELILHIRSCKDDRLRAPFIVGNNRSRTFIITKRKGSLQFQHDHRHADGKPDSISLYGGFTANTGSSSMQIFPADQFTTSLLPAAAGNVWWLELKEGKFIRYNLRRIGTDRLFIVEFDLTTPAPEPAAPWGWNED